MDVKNQEDWILL